MSGIKTTTQLNLLVPPTEPNHIVRLQDVLDLVDAKTKSPVRLISTTNIAGTYDGTAKTLTQTTAAEFVFDGITAALNDRILLNGQTDKTQNGIYTVTTLGVTGSTAGVLTRDADLDSSAEIIVGMRVFISEGNAYAGTVWKLTGAGPFTLDISNLEFVQDVVKYTEMLEKTFTVAGDGSTVEYSFTHDFGTLSTTFSAYDATTLEDVYVLFKRTSVNDFKVILGVPLGTGNDLVVIARAVVNPS